MSSFAPQKSFIVSVVQGYRSLQLPGCWMQPSCISRTRRINGEGAQGGRLETRHLVSASALPPRQKGFALLGCCIMESKPALSLIGGALAQSRGHRRGRNEHCPPPQPRQIILFVTVPGSLQGCQLSLFQGLFPASSSHAAKGCDKAVQGKEARGSVLQAGSG